MSKDDDKSPEVVTLEKAASNANKATKSAAKAMTGDKPKDTRSHEEIKADALANRAELAATLDAIEYRVNVPKRVGNRLRVLREENPAALAAIGVAAVAVVGAGVWLIARSLRN